MTDDEAELRNDRDEQDRAEGSSAEKQDLVLIHPLVICWFQIQ